MPKHFDWSTSYCGLLVRLETARTIGDHYAIRAAEQAISSIDAALKSACRTHSPVSFNATPEAMYRALQHAISEIKSTTGNPRAGGAQKIQLVLGKVKTFTHRKDWELCLREHEFAAASPAAVSLYGATARGDPATAGGAAQSTVASPVPADEAGEAPGWLTRTRYTPHRPALPSLNRAIEAWPRRFGSLKERRDFHRETGNTAVARLYDAAIRPIACRLRDVLTNLGCPPSEADVLEPEAAFKKLRKLQLQNNSTGSQHVSQQAITKQLQGIIEITSATLAQLAGRADEFAALSIGASRSSGRVRVSDPQALESWLRLEAIIADADKGRPQTGIDSPAGLPRWIEHPYFNCILNEHAKGADAWSASIEYLRELITDGRLYEAQALRSAHRRLLRAMADPTLQQPGEAIRITLPVPCREDATGPESLDLPRSPLPTSPLAGPLEIISKEVNPHFALIDDQPDPG